MVPIDMAFHDLTASGVSNAGAAGIGNIRRFVDNGGIAGIFQAPGAVFGLCREADSDSTIDSKSLRYLSCAVPKAAKSYVPVGHTT